MASRDRRRAPVGRRLRSWCRAREGAAGENVADAPPPLASGGWCGQTVPVHEPSDTIVAGALARLRTEDEHLGGDAEAALNSLTWDEGLETITQYGLQTFLWYELPRKWMTDLDGKRHLATALGRLLDLVGLPRYAAICRSPETDAVLAAYERDDREGFAAFRRAEERSGAHPPDLRVGAVSTRQRRSRNPRRRAWCRLTSAVRRSNSSGLPDCAAPARRSIAGGPCPSFPAFLTQP
jgi:hypothetical protein